MTFRLPHGKCDGGSDFESTTLLKHIARRSNQREYSYFEAWDTREHGSSREKVPSPGFRFTLSAAQSLSCASKNSRPDRYLHSSTSWGTSSCTKTVSSTMTKTYFTIEAGNGTRTASPGSCSYRRLSWIRSMTVPDLRMPHRTMIG